MDKEIRAARADLASLEREFGAAAANNAEQRRPTMRGFKIAHGRLGNQLRSARARVSRLFDQRRKVPKRVEVRELNERTVVKLATERKHLTDIIKMVAYQAESDLIALLRPHYARVDQEGRTLLHELFATAGDIRVSDSALNITLAPLSSPHRTHAAKALCEILDKTATIFPGSRLRIRFAVRPPPRIGLAFPGSPVERSTATPVPRRPDRRRDRTFLRYPMSGGLNLELADLAELRMPDCDLNNSRFREAVLFDADFEGADLRGCDFVQALTAGAKFARADMRGADLSGMSLVELGSFARMMVSADQQYPLLAALGVDVFP